MANVKNNLGAQRTRAAIEKVFLELAADLPLRKITVAQIVAASQISRGTFYLHYRDVYDLAEKVGEGALDQLEAELLDSMKDGLDGSGYPFLRILFAYIADNRDQVAFVFSPNVPDRTRGRMAKLMQRFSTSAIENRFGPISDEEAMVLRAYVGSGLFGLVEEWVAGGCPGSPEHMAHLAGCLVTQGYGGIAAG